MGLVRWRWSRIGVFRRLGRSRRKPRIIREWVGGERVERVEQR